MLESIQGQLELSYFVGGNENVKATLEIALAGTYKHSFSVSLSSPTAV